MLICVCVRGKVHRVYTPLPVAGACGLFLLYPTILRQIAGTYVCTPIYGKRWLEAELNYECFTSDHDGWIIFAGVWGGLYIVLLPLLAIGFIFWHYYQQSLSLGPLRPLKWASLPHVELEHSFCPFKF